MTGTGTQPERLSDPESDALAALDRGDREAALTLLMGAYGTEIHRFCRRMVAEEELAEEAHQMTFVQAFEGLSRFSRRSSLRTWLFSIARHRCLDALKVSRRRRRRFGPEPEAPDAPDPAAGADERLAARDRSRALQRCLQELAPPIRSAILLRFHQELTYPEIAVICGERPATLQARVARSMPTLRRCLEGLGQAA